MNLEVGNAAQPRLRSIAGECGIEIGSSIYPLWPISAADMDGLLARKETADIVAMPVYISRDADSVRVFPRPSRAYNVVPI